MEYGIISGGKCQLVNVSNDPTEKVDMDLAVTINIHNVFIFNRIYKIVIMLVTNSRKMIDTA